MVTSLFNALLYEPLYNGFVFLISVTPFHDVGLAIVLLTLVVRVLLLPVTHKTVRAQKEMRTLEPAIRQIKKETENDKQAQAKRVMELYQAHGVNPFSGCLVFIIQTPFILSLFWLFNQNFADGFGAENLYSFVSLPENIQTAFLGLLDVSEKSLFMALLVGASQYFQIALAMPPAAKKAEAVAPLSFKEEFARSFQTQARYVFHVMVFFLSYTVFP